MLKPQLLQPQPQVLQLLQPQLLQPHELLLFPKTSSNNIKKLEFVFKLVSVALVTMDSNSTNNASCEKFILIPPKCTKFFDII